MKTIFRFIGFGVLMAAFIAVGNVAGFGQDPCADTEGMTALDAKVRDLITKKTLPELKLRIEAGKQFLEKYGACEPQKEFADYLKTQIPIWEKRYADGIKAEAFQKLLERFDAALKADNWDEVYASYAQILTTAEKPDDFRAAELVLGSIGLDETGKNPPVTKWNDNTLKYAKMSIADLEAGKPFKTYGLGKFSYKDKEDALGWMNYTIGYIYFNDKKNKRDAMPYLYKASQLSTAKTNPVLYGTIAAYYYEDVRRLAGEVKTLIDSQQATDTPEVAQQKVDAIKAKVGILNGTTERALDAYGRAYKLIPTTDTAKAKYRESLRKNMEDLYKARFVKPEVPLDTWVATASAKPFPDPLSEVKPINDPEPVVPATGPATPGTKPPVVAKPATTTTSKPQATSAPTKGPAASSATAKGSPATKTPNH